ncbi:hypothetical protein RDABS01_010203, partial [Bienertia sinuspersici]
MLILGETWAGNSQVRFKNNAPSDQIETPKYVEDLMRERTWNATKVWQWFNKNDAQQILSTYVPQQEKEDEIIWLPKENAPAQKLLELLWKSPMSQRWKQFCWRLVHNALPTKDNLVKRQIEVNPTGTFCGGTETSDHLFLNCDFTKRIWSSSVLGLRIPSHPTLNISTWFKNMFIYLRRAKKDEHQSWPILVATAWPIRIHKNNIIFRKKKVDPKAILILAQAEVDR